MAKRYPCRGVTEPRVWTTDGFGEGDVPVAVTEKARDVLVASLKNLFAGEPCRTCGGGSDGSGRYPCPECG